MLRRGFGKYRYPMFGSTGRPTEKKAVVALACLLGGSVYMIYRGVQRAERRRVEFAQNFRPVNPDEVVPTNRREMDEAMLKQVVMGGRAFLDEELKKKQVQPPNLDQKGSSSAT